MENVELEKTKVFIQFKLSHEVSQKLSKVWYTEGML